jgi:hypothetical protein
MQFTDHLTIQPRMTAAGRKDVIRKLVMAEPLPMDVNR